MLSRRIWQAGIVLLALPGCTVDPKQFDALREQVRIQQRQLNELKTRQEEQALRLDTLNNGFKVLGDKAEDNARRIEDLEDRAVAASGGLETQVMARPSGAIAPAASAPVAPPPIPVPPPTPPPPARPAEPPAPPPPPPPAASPALPVEAAPAAPRAQPPPPKAEGELIATKTRSDKLYADALMLYSKREYAQAAGVFRELIEAYPADKLAGNAQYWIGECSYSLGKFEEAAVEFGKVEKDFPKSPKVPAALLKQSMSLRKAGRGEEARAAAQRLVSRHPASEEAGRAKEMFPDLKAADGEGEHRR